MKEITINYNGVKYSRPVLTTTDTWTFGLKIVPRLVSFANIIGNKVIEQTTGKGNDNCLVVNQTLNEIFGDEICQWLIEKLITDIRYPISVNGNPLTTQQEIDEHFGGDFIKLASVAFLFAVEMLGERDTLMKNLNDWGGNILECLQDVLKTFLETQLEAVKLTQGEKYSTMKKAKDKRKKV